MADEEFNSSDLEDLPPSDQENEFSNAGNQLADRMLQYQFEDRRLTKRAARTVQHQCGAPGTRYKQSQAANHFKCFMQSLGKEYAKSPTFILPQSYRLLTVLLSHSKNTCPNAEEIFRFVTTLAQRIKAIIKGKEVASLTTIKQYWRTMVTHCDFTFGKQFRDQYDRQVCLKINAHLDQEVRKGHLFRGRFHKAQWIGFTTLKKMCLAFLYTAYNDGCSSWDIIFNRYISVLLQSVCVARPGDVSVSRLYDGPECLCWCDIRLKLPDDGKTVNDMQGMVTVRWTKGHK